MTLPRFAAEASLYRTDRSYYGHTTASPAGGEHGMVTPQQGPGCTVLCSTWSDCNTKCGAWPPGLSNYNCWLDCLESTVDCLNGSTCNPGRPGPPRATQCTSTQRCCGSYNSQGLCVGTCWASNRPCP